MKLLSIALLATLSLTGCATIIRGTTQQVSINSDPSGAKVTISSGQSCLTPCNIEAERKNTLQITVKKEGCNVMTTAMVPTLAGAGAMLGGIVDYGTGAVYDLQPNPLFVTLNCDKPVVAAPEAAPPVVAAPAAAPPVVAAPAAAPPVVAAPAAAPPAS